MLSAFKPKIRIIRDAVIPQTSRQYPRTLLCTTSLREDSLAYSGTTSASTLSSKRLYFAGSNRCPSLSTSRGSSPLKSVHPGRLNSGFRAVCASWVQGTRRLAFSPHLYIVHSTFAFFSRFLLIERRISRKIKPGVSLTSATLSAHSSPTVTQVVCASKTAA